MWQRLSEWAFPVESASDKYRSRWKRFELSHGCLTLVLALPLLAIIYAGFFGALYVLQYVHLLEPLIWLYVGAIAVGMFFWVLRLFR